MSTTPASVRLDQIRYVILYVRDMDRALAFYRDVLGLKTLDRSPSWVELQTGSVTLALHLHQDRARRLGQGSPQVVFEVDDLDDACAALKDKGVSLQLPPVIVFENRAKTGKAVLFEDPDGNQLLFFSVQDNSASRPL